MSAAKPTSPLLRSAMAAAATSVLILLFAFLAVCSPPPAVAAALDITVGSTDTFWAYDWGSGAWAQKQATVRFVGEHALIYVSGGVSMPTSQVNSLGEAFDSHIYPTLTAAYGSEPNPGIDGDSRVAILIYDFHKTSVDGSFNPADIDPEQAAHSNQREMINLNLDAVLAEPGNAGALAAHEFAHLITHYRDVMLDGSASAAPESDWILEGMAAYAEHLCGYDDRLASQLFSFTNDPDFNLTLWTGERAGYGASYAFLAYLASREPEGFIQELVGESLDGVAGLNAALGAAGSSDVFESLLDDWVLANFLSDRLPHLWPYLYQGIDVSSQPAVLRGSMPLQADLRVSNYGAVYLDFPVTDRDLLFQAVVDGQDGAPLRAALVSWDSAGLVSPDVRLFELANSATGGTVASGRGYDRHTLVVWSRGAVGSQLSYGFRYSGSADPPGGVQFLDLRGSDLFYPNVAQLLEKGIISGKERPAGSGLWFFEGTANVLRAQFAKMIVEAIGHHTPSIDHADDPSFRDVKLTHDEAGVSQAYPFDYVEEASGLGIVQGYAGGYFHPYSAITRGQLVLMIIRGATAAGKPLPAYSGNAREFEDVPLSHPLYREIMTAYTAGILSGSTSGGKRYFYAGSPATRNHVSKMTAQLLVHLN